MPIAGPLILQVPAFSMPQSVQMGPCGGWSGGRIGEDERVIGAEHRETTARIGIAAVLARLTGMGKRRSDS